VKPTAIDARVSRRRYAPGGMARAERPSRPRTEEPAPRDEIVVALSAQKVFALRSFPSCSLSSRVARDSLRARVTSRRARVRERLVQEAFASESAIARAEGA